MDGSDEAGCASTLNEGIKMKVRNLGLGHTAFRSEIFSYRSQISRPYLQFISSLNLLDSFPSHSPNYRILHLMG